MLFLPNISVKHRCPEGILIINGEVINLMCNHRAYVLKQHFEKMTSIYINTFFPNSHLCTSNITVRWHSKIGVNRYLKIPYLKLCFAYWALDKCVKSFHLENNEGWFQMSLYRLHWMCSQKRPFLELRWVASTCRGVNVIINFTNSLSLWHACDKNLIRLKFLD